MTTQGELLDTYRHMSKDEKRAVVDYVNALCDGNDSLPKLVEAAASLRSSDIETLITSANKMFEDYIREIVGEGGLYNGEMDVPGAWTETKTIKGNKYAYRRWRQGGKLRSKYIGKVDS